MADEKPIEWDEDTKVTHRATLLVTTPPNPFALVGNYRKATVEDLRRACEAAGVELCGCGTPVEGISGEVVGYARPPASSAAQVAHLQAALEASESARADLADKLDERESQLAMARKCVELVQDYGECELTDFLHRVRVLRDEMAGDGGES